MPRRPAPAPSGLPIDEALPALRDALAAGRAAVLAAPPGAGKSTVVPLALRAEPWVRDRRIVMLEPRRLAARAVAERMAATLGEPVGRTVGYRMRLETRVSAATRIEVVTEGVLMRLLQHDPALEGIALVIFDEFHERSLQADLGLAFTLDARAVLVPELRLLVMSATLDPAPVARLLGDAAVVSAAGRAFPVETHFVGKGPPPLPSGSGGKGPGTATAEGLTAAIVRRALADAPGDVLVFLPGAREIRHVQSALEAAGLEAGTRLLPLYGDLDAAAQDAALAPRPPGSRRIVLATNIAETSLTIEGVRVVVDSGLVRRARFDPARGLSRLETERISRASAEQRRGRAGRTAPGVCYRAWSEGAHAQLAAATPPEILDADLAPLALELASWGAADAASLQWLDPPPAAALASARDLLRRLGALDPAGRVTARGRDMAELPVHPRLAHMLIEARRLGQLRLGAELAAILSERDLAAGAAARDADIATRLELLERGAARRVSAARVRRIAAELERRVGAASAHKARRPGARDDALVGPLLAFAYPDRIGRRRPGDGGRYTLANGRGAVLPEGERLARAEFLVAVDLDDRDRDARIHLAAALRREDLETHFAAELEDRDEVHWSSREQAVVARRTRRFGALLVAEQPLPSVPPEAARAAMLEGLRSLGVAALPWTEEARDLQARIEFVRTLPLEEAAGWPAVDDAALGADLESWLGPWLAGLTRREHLARLPLTEALLARIGWERRGRLDALAPSRLEVPSGSKIRIDYRDENAPAVAVRLQEVFGLEQSPRLGGGRVPVTFKLLSPARRPVQITRDLASFWRSGYADVRKDLRGRYPKHYWPEDPRSAEAIRGVRPRN